MPFWDDLDIYERGGVAGPRGTGAIIDQVPADTPAPVAAPAPSGPAQVGHNGAWNGLNREQWRDQWQGLGAMTPQAADAWLSSHGAAQAGGKGDRWTTPFGETLDLQQGRGGANDHGGTINPIWGSGPSAAPAPHGGPGDGGAMPTSPFGFGGGGGAPVASGLAVGQSGHLASSFDPFKYEAFTAPAAFTAPTADQARQDPGFQFGLDRGLDAISNRATAQGIRGGDVLKDFSKYANDQAATHYNEVYNRARDTYGLNFGNAFQTNQANNAGRLGAFSANTNADLGYGNLGVANRNVDLGYTRAANDFSLGQGNLALGNRQADQSFALGQGNLALGNKQADTSAGLGWANYGLGAQGQQFFQDYQFPISTGFNAANATGGYGSIYAQNAGQNAVGAANASGAAGMAGANAWNSALSNGANTALGAYYYTHPYQGGQ